MSFLNKYISNHGSKNYTNSLKSGCYIYSIGKVIINNIPLGLITKTDINGNLIWEKTYSLGSDSTRFLQLVNCDNSDILVLGINKSTDQQNLDLENIDYVILRLDSDGEKIWAKKIEPNPGDNNYEFSNFIEVSLAKTGIENYSLLSVRNFKITNQDEEFENLITNFDNAGHDIKQQVVSLDHETLKLVGIKYAYEKIYLFGRKKVDETETGVLIILDNSLNILNTIILENLDYLKTCFIKNILFTDVYIYLILKMDDTNIICKINKNDSNFSIITSKRLPIKAIDLEKAYNNSKSIYFELPQDSTSGLLIKLNLNLDTVWIKNLNLSSFIKEVTENEIIGSTETDSFIGKLNLSLHSCATSEYSIEPNEDILVTLSVGTSSSDEASFPISDIEVTVDLDGSSIDVICESIPESKNEYDTSVCSLVNYLQDTLIPCGATLPADAFPENHDFHQQEDCIQNFLNTLQNFIDNNDFYNLSTIFISQINYINEYLNKPDVRTYSNAWNSIQFILKYLSSLGSCSCSNENLQLTDKVQFQSSHLYLQAAGSVGNDSTKGIHLRWALKDALASHLPKGFYATNSTNFNKPNDFVKIYRAPYIENKIILDFNTPPNFVFDNQNKWVYTIDKKSFNIYFKNSTKYLNARSNYDPMINPLAFIEEYGENIIEIENLTNLFFAVKSNFIITSGISETQFEILSVEKNNIVTDRIVSLRGKYTTTQLNYEKLFSENIRSIRFLSRGAYAERFEFEFYSDFVSSTDRDGNWQYLGKHALTKDSDIAFNRLEPIADSVNGKWLRYNDDAFVNIENYRNKWNDAPTEEEKIEFVVDKYIELSDDPNNPLANETFNFNDLVNEPIEGYTPDPEEYSPNQSESIEISNLQLLQIASLDYHVARMLGLGMLDLTPELYESQYVYMAEYYSLGDLGDGKGAREIQHIYCSLPTSINDERLPIPIDLKQPSLGITYGNGTEAPQQLTNELGYTSDGQTRFISLFHEPLHEEIPNSEFFSSSYEFISASITEPVYAGVEYRNQNSIGYRKPELSYDKNYFNIDVSVVEQSKKNETLPIIIPEVYQPLYIHREKENGTHVYGSYGINWFSRATISSTEHYLETIIIPKSQLLPPTNINAHLIRKELPLMFTSSIEQAKLDAISETDNTLIRLTFDYNHRQELKEYHKKINNELVNGYIDVDDNDELFADDVEIFFRNALPNIISGNVFSVTDDPTNPILSTVVTSAYTITSSGTNINVTPAVPNEQIIPNIETGTESNYIGSILKIGEKEFIIHEITINNLGYPIFKVFKRGGNSPLSSLNSNIPLNELESPVSNELFVVVENMLSSSSWSSPAPIPFKVNIDSQVTSIHSEEIEIISTDAATIETYLQKFRGIYKPATINKFLEPIHVGENIEQKHLGLYKIEFQNGFNLNQHSQYSTSNHSVEWHNGYVRLHTFNSPNGKRADFQVIKTENIGSTNSNLVLYVLDPTFNPEDAVPNYEINGAIVEGQQVVNYYPSYKVYLYKDIAAGITADNILPSNEDDTNDKYSIFGLRAHDLNQFTEANDFSNISIPAIMYAQKLIEPKQPELPKGGKYATRPDFFGKSTYTFTTKFEHKPFSIQFNRASDIQILHSLYKEESITNIRDIIFNKGNDEYFSNRWENLLSFNYDYPSNDLINTDGLFKKFPENNDGISLPLPDSEKLIESINNFIIAHNNFYNNIPEPVQVIESISNLNQIIIPEVINRNSKLTVTDFIKNVMHNCFVPLTEIPVVYSFIKKEIDGYKPIPKKQNIRDRNGYLLKPTDPLFDMAPMMVIKTPNSNIEPPIGNNEVQFTDFGIDGASNAKYFYSVREFDLQMKTGEYSPIMGPISLVNSEPPTAPEIIKVTPNLENRVLGILPSINFEINSYSEIQNIKKVTIYRATEKVESLSIRTMKKVKEIDLETENLLDLTKWEFTDNFDDLGYIPYGDALYYRLTVSREIKYNNIEGELVIDYTPSEASKLVITNIVENYSPESPILKYASEPILEDGKLNYVTFYWDKKVYNGIYHFYKMNNQGNWIEIAKVSSNNDIIYLPIEQTSVNDTFLETKNSEGSTIYHHFKVIVENTSGMFSSQENILSIYREDTWDDIGGIDEMIVEGTFIVRTNE
jgi:hypothetical protein